MPATTQGFSVQQMPNVQFADPRLLTPAYGDIVPNVSRGVGFATQLQQIADEARMRPLKQRLLEIQQAEAEARLGGLPLQQEIDRARLSEIQQNAAVPRMIAGDITLEDQTKIYPSALDDQGLRTGPEDRVVGDLVQIESGRAVGPGGVITPNVVRKTLKTAEQRIAEEAKQAASIRATDALATNRLRGKEQKLEALVQLRDDALAEGRDDVATIYQKAIEKESTARPLLSDVDMYNRRVANLAAEAGVTLDVAKRIVGTTEGANALSKAAASRKADAKSPFGAPALTPKEQELIRGDTLDSALSSAYDTPATAYESADAVKAAFRAGQVTKAEAEKILREQFGFN